MKTIKVADALAMANAMLAAPGGTRDGRIAVAYFISNILHATGNYAGFRYLGGWVEGADDSRREYYSAPGIVRVVKEAK